MAKARVPADTLVLPLYVLAPESVRVPAPNLVRLPEPAMMPLYATLSDRVKTIKPLFVILPVTEPDVPKLPILSVPPALIVVPPL